MRGSQKGEGAQHRPVTTDLDALLTALYVHVDDRLRTPRWRGLPPRLTDAEPVTLAVAQPCSASTARPAGCASPTPTCTGCSRLCPGAPPATSVCGPLCHWSNGRSGHRQRTCDWTTCGSWTPPRWSTPAPARPSSAPTWSAGGTTATAAPTPASTGVRSCTWCAARPGCPSPGPWSTPKIDERQVLAPLGGRHLQ